MPVSHSHVYRRSIRFADTDAAGVAHFSRLLIIVEEAIHDFFQVRCIPILEKATAWPVVSIHADYSAACRFQDEISVALSLDKAGNSSLAFSFVASKADGTVCFVGQATLCHIDTSKKASAPISTETRKALGVGAD